MTGTVDRAKDGTDVGRLVASGVCGNNGLNTWADVGRLLDPHVWTVQVDLHRDVVETMAPLRSIEEPRGSSGLKDPNGALLRDVEEL